MTVTEFLLARIADDESVARRVIAEDSRRGDVTNHVCYCEGQAVAAMNGHRLLAECQAKRAIIELHVPDSSEYPSPTGQRCEACSDTRHDGWWYEETPWPCPTLRHLAAVYADHPDYRKEWRP